MMQAAWGSGEGVDCGPLPAHLVDDMSAYMAAYLTGAQDARGQMATSQHLQTLVPCGLITLLAFVCVVVLHQRDKRLKRMGRVIVCLEARIHHQRAELRRLHKERLP